MKKIRTSDIQEGVRAMGAVKATLDHLQEAYQDAITELMYSLTAGSTSVLALYGLVDSDGSATAWNISAGAIYYNGEIFTIPAFIGTHVSQVPVLSIVTTYRGGDPIKFSDNNTYNVHEIRTMQWALGAPGSGIVDFSGLIQFKDRLRSNVLNVVSKSGDVISGTLEVQGGIRTQNSGPFIVSKKFDIGDWNMVANFDRLIDLAANGIDYKKVLSISIIIRNDDDTQYFDFVSKGSSTGAVTAEGGRVFSISSLGLSINRITGGAFDSTSFDSTGYNRGWIFIDYMP